jgi:DNA-binding transcriptional ArsR family regulator
VSASTASHHLSRLADAGLATARAGRGSGCI